MLLFGNIPNGSGLSSSASVEVVVGVMLFITSQNQYSIFTYFTNYEEDIRNEVVNEFEEWQQQLDEREKELDEREEKLQEP